MRCPYCDCVKSKVVDKRGSENFRVTRRRRECLECGKRYTTYERIESIDIIVVKKDGKREQFERQKLERGIMKACEKRPVSIDEIKKLVSDIELHLRNKASTEIPSNLIGRLVMTRLKKLDKVSYIRFASVYKDFKDPEEFQEEISKIK
ncbi:transcriptional repressor NrdR [Candidatus Woesearchaeota archaeon]|nr:transcriptional repressor NrdR [Candidatus Woesearchaeota archaeon]